MCARATKSHCARFTVGKMIAACHSGEASKADNTGVFLVRRISGPQAAARALRVVRDAFQRQTGFVRVSEDPVGRSLKTECWLTGTDTAVDASASCKHEMLTRTHDANTHTHTCTGEPTHVRIHTLAGLTYWNSARVGLRKKHNGVTCIRALHTCMGDQTTSQMSFQTNA